MLIRESRLTTYQACVEHASMTQGLEGIVAASTRLSRVDGEAGTLILAGYAVEDLAPHATFEAVSELFLDRRLPAGRRAIPRETVELLRTVAARRAPPMDALLMATPTLRVDGPEDVIAAFPTIVGTYWRLLHGEAPVAVRDDLSHAAHYLHQLSGEEPAPERTRALETYVNTVCDHGLNA